MIEAMAMELPIVAFDIPAIREVVEDGRSAVLVPAGATSALATELDRLLTDERAPP